MTKKSGLCHRSSTALWHPCPKILKFVLHNKILVIPDLDTESFSSARYTGRRIKAQKIFTIGTALTPCTLFCTCTPVSVLCFRSVPVPVRVRKRHYVPYFDTVRTVDSDIKKAKLLNGKNSTSPRSIFVLT
jgi:hypothetical protein